MLTCIIIVYQTAGRTCNNEWTSRNRYCKGSATCIPWILWMHTMSHESSGECMKAKMPGVLEPKKTTKRIMTHRAEKKLKVAMRCYECRKNILSVCVFFQPKSCNIPNTNITVDELHLHANSILTGRLAKPLITVPAMHDCGCRWTTNEYATTIN